MFEDWRGCGALHGLSGGTRSVSYRHRGCWRFDVTGLEVSLEPLLGSVEAQIGGANSEVE